MLFETERLKVIRYSFERLDEIHELYNDKGIIEYTSLDRKGKTKEQLTKGITFYNEMYAKTNNSQGKWLITDKSTEKVIGFTGMFYIDEIDKTELSYSLLKNYRGKGFAIECAKGMKKYAFEKLNLKDVCALVRHDNLPSEKVAQRMSMVCVNDNIQLWGFTFKLYEQDNKQY